MSGLSKGLRIVFMGTPEFAVPALMALLAAGYNIIAVYTRPPAPKGRGHHVQKSPVHQIADAHHIPVFTPISLKKSISAQEEFAALKPDLAVVAAYGLILPLSVLEAPHFGCLNIHASILPRWRGASPIHHAILSGDPVAGVTIMQMEEGLDTGPMIVTDQIPISREMTTPILQEHLAHMGARLIVETVAQMRDDQFLQSIPQPETGVTYAPLLKKENGLIDWGLGAESILRQVRALTPWPGTMTKLADGQTIKILACDLEVIPAVSAAAGTLLDRSGVVACGDGQGIRLTRVQSPTGKPLTISDLCNGGYLVVGYQFQS